jgi:thioesterase domain-containing protein
VHPGSGNVLCYMGLARHLGEGQPFYGLRDVTIEEQEQSNRSIQEMASEYIEAIKEVQERGPYYVGGYSFGAMVAYEMAQQLRERGEEVGMVALVDGVSPSESRERFSGADEATLLAIIATEMRSEGEKTIKEMSEELRGKGKREQMREVMRYVMRGEQEKEEEGRGEGIWAGAEGYIEKQLEVFKGRIEAVERYEEKRYEGAATLIMSGGVEGEEGAMGWEKVMGEGLEVRRMRGGHATMLREPEVEELGQRLRECLDKARSCSAGRLVNPPRNRAHSEILPKDTRVKD